MRAIFCDTAVQQHQCFFNHSSVLNLEIKITKAKIQTATENLVAWLDTVEEPLQSENDAVLAREAEMVSTLIF